MAAFTQRCSDRCYSLQLRSHTDNRRKTRTKQMRGKNAYFTNNQPPASLFNQNLSDGGNVVQGRGQTASPGHMTAFGPLKTHMKANKCSCSTIDQTGDDY